jgi:hypothetical protein
MILIHGNSKDPVLVKKVYLKIWTLRSEVEQIIKKANAKTPEEIEAIKNEYAFKKPVQEESGFKLIQGGDDPESTEPQEEQEQVEAAETSEQDSEDTEGAGEETQEEVVKTQVIQRGSHHLEDHQVHNGVCVLAEIAMDNFYFFTSKKFLEGQSIVIEFQVPKRFVLNAEVQYCRPFNIKSRVISENKLQCRASAKFTFLKEGERTLLRRFIQSIEPEIPEIVEVPKAKSDDDGDGFDDLDGLDF